MEALPRFPMISFELKQSPEYVEFGPTLKQYIKDHYGEDPNLYHKACTDLEQLRQAAVQVSRDFMGCNTLKKYYTQLEYLQKRFPMTEGGEAAIVFTWEDIQTGRDHVISDIKFEQACILYNIGSLHSLLGVLDSRHNVEGMRISCTHFQCAAWVFEYLRDNFSTSSMSTDMSYELLSFNIVLMLAQAQECILEKSLIDNRKNNITAKVAAQVVELYKDASRLIDLADQKQQISNRMHKDWGRRLLMKAAFYQCITYYFLGRRSEELEKHGECLSYYTAARDELNRANQLAKNEAAEVLECLQFAKDVVLGKYESAKKDNDFVYHDKVPALESLPEVKGASLAKGIPVNLTDKEISGPDIFQKLVPIEAHEASSVYSEEKAKLSRQVVSEIEQKNMELEQFMSSLQLDVDQLTPKTDLIPEHLMEKCAAMSVRTNAIKELTDAMASVSGLSTEVDLGIKEVEELIQEDTEKSDQFEKQYGKKSVSYLSTLQEDLQSFKQRHQEGSQLNATLHRAMSTHTSNLKILALTPSEIQTLLPPSQPSLSNEDQEIVTEIQRLMQKVNEMKEQRKALLEQFRDKIQKDDITNVLVTQEKTNKEAVFMEELKKHDQVVGYIQQNLASQENILRHLTDTNAKFALIRQAYDEASARRENMVQELILSYDKYQELLAKSQKGVEYYNKLLQNVTRVLERCRSECKVRQEERDMLITKLAPKAAPPSRPTAPKPDLTGNLSSAPENANMPEVSDFASLPPQLNPSEQLQNLPPKFEGPKLKDYLPFMKPRSFGPKAPSSSEAPQGTTASGLPSLPGGDVLSQNPDSSLQQRYPGLDPALASVLPATLAQYLAAMSSGATSMATSAQSVSSVSSFREQPGSNTPKQMPPAAAPISQAAEYPHSAGSSSAVLPGHLRQPEQQYPQGYISMNPPAAEGKSPGSTGANPGSSGAHPEQPPSSYDHYGYVSSQTHPQHYPDVSRQANTSTVSSLSHPIFSPGSDQANQTFGQQLPPPSSASSQQQLIQQHSHAGPMPTPANQHYSPGHQYASSGQQYAPSGQQAAPSNQQYAPSGQQYAPSGQQYAPSGHQPAPSSQQYAPSGRQSAPSGQQYAPSSQQYAPTGQQYASSDHQSAPSSQQYAPSGQQYAPSGQQYAPPGQQSALPGQQLALPGQQLALPGQQSAPSGQQYALSGQQSAHSGQQYNLRSGSAPGVAGPSLVDSSQQPPPTSQQWAAPSQLPVQGYPSSALGQVPYDQIHPSASAGVAPLPQQFVSHSYSNPAPKDNSALGAVNSQYQLSSARPTSQPDLLPVFGSGPNQTPFPSQQRQGGLTNAPGSQGNMIGTGGSISDTEAFQRGLTSSPHQSPSRTSQSRVPVTSVGYLYAKNPHQGPFIADYAYPSQQLYQNTAGPAGGGMYQPSQSYSGGYQHSIDHSYQRAQTLGNFTSHASVYGQTNQQISSQNTGSQNSTNWNQAQGNQAPAHISDTAPQNSGAASQMPGQLPRQAPETGTGRPEQGFQASGQVLQTPRFGSQVLHQGSVPPSQFSQMSGQFPQQSGQFPPGAAQGSQVQHQIPQLPGQGPQAHQIPQLPGQGPHVQHQIPQLPGQPGQGPQAHQIPQLPGQRPQVQHQIPQLPGQGPQVQHQIPQVPHQPVQGPQAQQQIPQIPVLGPQAQNQFNQIPGFNQMQVQGQRPTQVTPIPSGSAGQILGQNSQMPVQGLNMASQYTMMPGQAAQPGTQQIQASPMPNQGLGPQWQSHGNPSIPGQMNTGPNIGGQYSISGNNSATMAAVGLQPTAAGLYQQQQQQQPGNQVQHQYSSQQFPFLQQQLAPGHPGAVGTPPSHQPGVPPALQPGTGQQQVATQPYQHSTSVPGSFSQVPPTAHPPGSVSMHLPLQPAGAARPTPPPSQGVSRPSTPASQGSTGARDTPTSPAGSHKSASRQNSSLDDILSSSPNGFSDTIITPQVLTDQERQLQKEEALKNQASLTASEPYSSQSSLSKLLADVEAFGKFVDDLSVTILGVSRLDTVWKSLLDSQDASVKKQSMAIARCYPMKNRDPEIMPYDETRVILTTTKDDYINASWLNDLAPSCPKFITTQAPTALTMGEFWAMVYEQGSEVLVQVTSEYETGKKYPVYYPVDKDQVLEQGSMLLTLQQSVKFKQHWVERIIYLKNTQTKQGRTIVHLQYKNWPVSGFPEDNSSVVHFISEVHNFYMQQRSLTKPIIVHCGLGIGRTGVFTLVYTAMQEILHGNGLTDIPGLTRRMLQKRKGIIHKKEQLKFCYDAVLCFAEEYLQKRGMLVKNPHFSNAKKSSAKSSPKHHIQPQSAANDIVLGTVDLQTIRENVSRLHVHSEVDRKDDGPDQTQKRKCEGSPAIGNSCLPDVVQQYNDFHPAVGQADQSTKPDMDSQRGSDASSVHLESKPIGPAESLSNSQTMSISDLNLSLTPVGIDSAAPANNLTPDGGSAVPANFGVPSSLAQLQDPATFTLGSPDSKKKSKITKANFHQSMGTLQTNTTNSDPADPLGSLDPLWTLAKK